MPWHCKPTGGYISNNPVAFYPDSNGEDNCRAIWNVMRPLGWTATACAGLLTCIAIESGFNPWRWESDHILSTTQVNSDALFYGYGLVQWTPASFNNAVWRDTSIYPSHAGKVPNKYIENPYAINLSGYAPNFSDRTGGLYDGQAQMVYLDTYGTEYPGNGYDYYRSTDYPYYGNMCPYFIDFKTDTTHTPAELATVWAVNFERSSDPMGRLSERNALAPLLYQLITGTPPPTGNIPVWLLMKWRNDNLRSR